MVSRRYIVDGNDLVRLNLTELSDLVYRSFLKRFGTSTSNLCTSVLLTIHTAQEHLQGRDSDYSDIQSDVFMVLKNSYCHWGPRTLQTIYLISERSQRHKDQGSFVKHTLTSRIACWVGFVFCSPTITGTCVLISYDSVMRFERSSYI